MLVMEAAAKGKSGVEMEARLAVVKWGGGMMEAAGKRESGKEGSGS